MRKRTNDGVIIAIPKKLYTFICTTQTILKTIIKFPKIN